MGLHPQDCRRRCSNRRRLCRCTLAARRWVAPEWRKIVDAIFSYTNRNTHFTAKFFVRGNVTEEFPFLVSKMSAYYDR